MIATATALCPASGYHYDDAGRPRWYGSDEMQFLYAIALGKGRTRSPITTLTGYLASFPLRSVWWSNAEPEKYQAYAELLLSEVEMILTPTAPGEFRMEGVSQ